MLMMAWFVVAVCSFKLLSCEFLELEEAVKVIAGFQAPAEVLTSTEQSLTAKTA